VFSESAILIHDALQTTSPFTDAVVNEALWQCAPLQHNRLLQLINNVELLAVLDLLLAPKLCNPPDLNPGYWGHVSGSTKATFSRRRYAIVLFRAVYDGAPFCCT